MAEALTLGRGTRRCGTGRIIPRVDSPTQRGKGSLAKFLATMSTIMHLNLSILMEKRKIGGDIHFHLMSLSDIDTFIKCRIEPFEYGDHGDSSTQDWVYAVKIIYKDTVQERRFVMFSRAWNEGPSEGS